MTVQRLGLTVLGSTGSVGANTLAVAARHPERFELIALTACSDHLALLDQVREHRPRYAVMVKDAAAAALDAAVWRAGLPTEVLAGTDALAQVAALPATDVVMAAIVGAAGLLPTLAAARAGKRILLANKEALVMSGALFMQAATDSGAEIVPIDSEHNAIFQCLGGAGHRNLRALGVQKIILTASGGPFRTLPAEKFASVTPQQACEHPNWDMGAKISVDSATLMNKGLEVIEACWLFATTPDKVEVVVHPQSVVHSMVEYADGSVMAQLGHPDMRTPIAYGLGFPQRIDSGLPALDLIKAGPLTFEAADTERFPCLGLGYAAAQQGGRAPTALNAANEVAVAEFLAGRLRFDGIPRVIEDVLSQTEPGQDADIESVLDSDRRARALAVDAMRVALGRPA